MAVMRYALVVLAAVLLVTGTTLAQEPANPREAASIAQGELVKVDTNAKTIVIRTAPGPQMVFSYTDQTRVAGADQGVAGLATMTGTPLTIHFTKKDQANVATQIEVQKKS